MLNRVIVIVWFLILMSSIGACCFSDKDYYYGDLIIHNKCLSSDFVVTIKPVNIEPEAFEEGLGVHKINSCGLASLMDKCKEEVDLMWRDDVGSVVELNLVVTKKGENKPFYGTVIKVKGRNNTCGYKNSVTIPTNGCKYKLF